MSDGFQLGSGRRRGRSHGGTLLAVALGVLALTYWRFAPGRAGPWEAAGTQIEKKLPRLVLFHPAWQSEVLDRMPSLPIVLIDGRQHLDLAGFGEVLFASETAQPETLVDNIYALEEWRDFAGKAVAVLRVAAHSLSVDFQQLRVAIEDPPGVAFCNGTGVKRTCERQGVVVERRDVMIGGAKTRCVWVEAKGGREVALRLPLADLETLTRAQIYLASPDGAPSGAARATLRIDDRDVVTATGGAAGKWYEAPAELTVGAKRLEVAVTSDAGVCVDVELL